MLAVYKRELRACFTSPVGWLYLAFLTVVLGILLRVNCFVGGYPQMEQALASMLFLVVTILALCLLTMRSLSEERRQKTDQLLYSLPLSTGKVVLGKYLAMLTVVLAACAVFGLCPLVLGRYGAVNYASSYTGLLGYFCLCAALLAMGMFASSLTENQVVAAILGMAFMFASFLMSSLASYIPATGFASLCVLWALAAALGLVVWALTRSVPFGLAVGAAGVLAAGVAYFFHAAAFEGLVQTVMGRVSVFDRFYLMVMGTLDWTTVFFDLSVTALFLFFAMQSMEKRRWS